MKVDELLGDLVTFSDLGDFVWVNLYHTDIGNRFWFRSKQDVDLDGLDFCDVTRLFSVEAHNFRDVDSVQQDVE